MDKAYLAAPIFNAEQLRVVRDMHMDLTMLEFQVFSPYHASRDIWKGRAPKDCSPEEREQVLRGNIDNLHWADLLVSWVGGTEDGRTDTGVVWEMGYFNALSDYRRSTQTKQKAFTIGFVHPTDKRQNMNLMLAGTVDAVAYGPAQLHRALVLCRDNDCDAVREQFNPNLQIVHEKEAIA